MYQMLRDIYSYIFLESEPSLKIPSRREARENVMRLRRFVKLSLEEAKGGLPSSVLGGLTSLFFGENSTYGNPILKRLLSTGSSTEKIVNDTLAVVSCSIELSQIFTHVVNFYLPQRRDTNAWKPSPMNTTSSKSLGEDVAESISSIVSKGSDENTLSILEGYVLEALRLDPVTAGIFRIATADLSGPGSVSGDKGDRFYFDLAKAAVSPKAFDDPDKINPHRDPASYLVYEGDGAFKTLGQSFVVRAAAEVLRAVFTLGNVHRTAGKAGILRRFKEPVVTVDDVVNSSTTEVPYKSVDAQGDDIDTDWTEEVFVYKLQSGVSEKNGKIPADRWAYVDPEIGHRISVWATGLTIEYRAEV